MSSLHIDYHENSADELHYLQNNTENTQTVQKKKHRKFSFLGLMLYSLFAILLFFAISLFIFNSIYRGVYVEGNSMQNTLQDGDFLYMTKGGTPKHDAIILIQTDKADAMHTNITLIKRVIGLAGDRLLQKNEKLVRIRANSTQEEDCGPIGKDYLHKFQERVIISPDCVFVVGDNRNNSQDSRAFGELPLSNLVGIIAPWSIKAKGFMTKLYHLFHRAEAYEIFVKKSEI